MSFLMVVPVIDKTVTDEFIAGLKVNHNDVFIIDNGTPHVLPDWDGPRYASPGNIGVATSWNLGAKAVLGSGIDWLVIASAALRWGPSGGVDFTSGLETIEGHPAVTSTQGWHLCALHHTTLEAVGLFDENFFPGYFEDTDYLYRMYLAGFPSPRENGEHWGHIYSDAEYGESAHALNNGLVTAPMNELGYYYRRKWGGNPGSETFTNPFDVSNYPIWKWPAR